MSGLAGCLGDDDDGDGNGDGGDSDGDSDSDGTGDGSGDGDTVVVGGLVPRSGPLSALGASQENGIEVAVQYLNEEMDGINGNEVEVIFEDTGTDPETGREGASRLVESEEVDLLVGAVSGAVSASIAEYAGEQMVPYWPYGGANQLTGENCNPATFRYSTNTVQDARGAVQWALDELGEEVWIHYADYQYGQDIASDFETEIENAGGTIVDTTSTPIGESEFGSYLTDIQGAEPDWVLMGVTGADLIAMVEQATEFGLKEEIGFFSINVTTQDIRQGVGEAGVGIYGNVRYHENYDSDQNRELVDAYTAEYDEPPTDTAAVAWASLMLHAQAAEAAGSIALDDIRPELEGLEAGSPMGDIELRACDHQAIRDIPVGEITEPDEHEWPGLEILATTPGEDAARSCEETGCSMDGA